MQEYLRKIISSKEKGLYICQLPTGYGKSYSVSKVISEIAKDRTEKRPIIYLTTLKKNLPESEIKSFLNNDMRCYNENVLRIYSNVDGILANIKEITIPDEYKTAKYSDLVSKIYKLEKAEKNHINDNDYLNELRDRVSDAEKAFRHEISNMLKRKFGKKSKMLDAIHNDSNFKWIGELYPAVFTDERKILLMTVSKFLTRNSALVEPSYDFLSLDMIKDSIIFIDEFDASKSWIQGQKSYMCRP